MGIRSAVDQSTRIELSDCGKHDGQPRDVAAIDLQIYRLLSRYALSPAVAHVVAELAFCSGRTA